MDTKLLMLMNPQIVMAFGAVVVGLIAIFTYAILAILFPGWPNKLIDDQTYGSQQNAQENFDYNLDKFSD